MCSRLSRWEVGENGSLHKRQRRFSVPSKLRLPLKAMAIFFTIPLVAKVADDYPVETGVTVGFGLGMAALGTAFTWQLNDRKQAYSSVSLMTAAGLVAGASLGLSMETEEKAIAPSMNSSFATPANSFGENKKTYFYPSQDTAATPSALPNPVYNFGSPTP